MQCIPENPIHASPPFFQCRKGEKSQPGSKLSLDSGGGHPDQCFFSPILQKKGPGATLWFYLPLFFRLNRPRSGRDFFERLGFFWQLAKRYTFVGMYQPISLDSPLVSRREITMWVRVTISWYPLKIPLFWKVDWGGGSQFGGRVQIEFFGNFQKQMKKSIF